MGDTTGIGWTDKTWNPWHGCTKVSPGCAHCYMYRDKARYGQDPESVVRSKTMFRAPLKWKEPARVFTCSWSDWFHEAADDWRAEAWDVIRQTPHLTYQILTKRPERIASYLPDDWGKGWPNVWLGVSVENQRWVTRAEILAAIPAALRFISAEPLLGPVDFCNDLFFDDNFLLEYFGWLIVGGESGPDFRPMREEWARDLLRQSRIANTAFFLKQLGGWPDARAHDKAVLDGRTYTEFPVVVEAETP
jgi:protein gp37